ncbi:MAG TPA: DinB family protein [Membranihabitans sp.]|nr:DinB family protein [Membranihabitans sp.]
MEEKQLEINTMVLKDLIRSTKNFVEYMKEYGLRRIPRPRTDSNWDIEQLIEHVILVDKSVLSILKEQPFGSVKKEHIPKYQMRDIMLNRRRKIRSLKMLQPTQTDKSRQQLLAEFQEIRNEIMNQLKNSQFDLQSLETYPHPALGPLTRRDWLYMLCFHSDRHIAQSQEILFIK